MFISGFLISFNQTIYTFLVFLYLSVFIIHAYFSSYQLLCLICHSTGRCDYLAHFTHLHTLSLVVKYIVGWITSLVLLSVVIGFLLILDHKNPYTISLITAYSFRINCIRKSMADFVAPYGKNGDSLVNGFSDDKHWVFVGFCKWRRKG